MVNYRNIMITALRWALGAMFLFSGAVKCVDPVGTSIYIDKYLATYAMEALMPISEILGVVLSVVEFSLGVLLIVGICRRVVTLLSVIMLSIFSVITLLSATWLPIGDCGCFGDAVKLSPIATLVKNLVMLPVAYMLWRSSDMKCDITLRKIVVLVLSIALPLGINIYALNHLPLVDFMPYKVGTDLKLMVAKEREIEQNAIHTLLRFKRIATGELLEFDSSDTSCWMDEGLEYVNAITITEELPDMVYSDFRLYNDNGDDVSMELLQRKGRIALLCINDAKELDDQRRQNIEWLYGEYPASAIYVLTCNGERISDIATDSEWLSVDAMTLRSIIRADIGVVILNNGIVEYKSEI